MSIGRAERETPPCALHMFPLVPHAICFVLIAIDYYHQVRKSINSSVGKVHYSGQIGYAVTFCHGSCIVRFLSLGLLSSRLGGLCS